MKEMAAHQHQRLDDTLDIMHKDVEGRFEDNAALLSLNVFVDKETDTLKFAFRASGDAAVLAAGVGDAMQDFPEFVAILQSGVMMGDADAIMANFLDFTNDNTLPPYDDSDDPFGLG